MEPFERGLARAERFYSAKRWADAKSAFAALSPGNADQRELVALRLAASDYYLGNRRQAREALRPLLDSDARGAEARYVSLLATKALGDRAGYVRQARQLAERLSAQPVGRGSAERPGHRLHHHRRGRRRRRRLP